jgi:hypothetical protein
MTRPGQRSFRGGRTEDHAPGVRTWQECVLQTCAHEPARLGEERGFDVPGEIGLGIRLGEAYQGQGHTFVVVDKVEVAREGWPKSCWRVMVRFTQVPGAKA